MYSNDHLVTIAVIKFSQRRQLLSFTSAITRPRLLAMTGMVEIYTAVTYMLLIDIIMVGK